MGDFNYGIGTLITITISIGAAIIAYSSGLIPYDLYNLPAWILGPLGVYTLIYSFTRRNDVYNLAWGMVFLAVTLISVMYKLVNVIMIVGVLLVALGILSLIAYIKGLKK